VFAVCRSSADDFLPFLLLAQLLAIGRSLAAVNSQRKDTGTFLTMKWGIVLHQGEAFLSATDAEPMSAYLVIYCLQDLNHCAKYLKVFAKVRISEEKAKRFAIYYKKRDLSHDKPPS
jgi:hypothetical protein